MLKFIPSLVAITHCLDIVAKYAEDNIDDEVTDFFDNCHCNYEGCRDGCCDETCKFKNISFLGPLSGCKSWYEQCDLEPSTDKTLIYC